MPIDRRLAVGLAVLLLVATPAFAAQPIDYDPRRAQALRDCDAQQFRGRLAQAKACYINLLNSSSALALQAEAAWALGDMRQANELFKQAVQANPRFSAPKVRWGRLFLQAHNHQDALAIFGEVLQNAPNDPYAQLGMAQLFAERFEGAADRLVAALLSEHDNLAEAHLLAAQLALEDGRLDAADESLDRAAKLIDQQKLPPLDVYTLRAVLELARRGDADNPWAKKAQSHHPHYGTLYQKLARFEIMRRRYREATLLLRRAVEVQPDLWESHAELGVNLLRVGDTAGARQHLQLAYAGDPYSGTTVNTLRLLDSLDQFELSVVQLPIPKADGASGSVELRMRMATSEAAVLRPYVQQLAHDSIASFSRRYGFEPREPVTLELYPDHDDFAVRVTALPGIGLLGVTFGYLVAMDSPSGRPLGDFHWGSTLWHEMAHVFTLELTDHRVPRWLSEGISVFEEWTSGPTPGVSVSPEALAALRDNKFLPVSELDSGFIRPQYPEQVQVSYMQAGLICYFIEQRWGFDQLVALLRQYSRETTVQAAVEATFKIPAAEFDKQFDAFVRARYATILASTEEWQTQYNDAGNAIKTQRWDAAVAAARRATEIYPEQSGSDSAWLLLARALDQSDRRNEAIDALHRYRRIGGWHPPALRDLAQWLDAAGRREEANEVLLSLNYLDPLNAAQHRELGERLLASNQVEQALREYRVLLALSPQDTAPANLGIARALQTLGDTAASRRALLEALESAPHYRPAQDMLLQTTGARTE